MHGERRVQTYIVKRFCSVFFSQSRPGEIDTTPPIDLRRSRRWLLVKVRTKENFSKIYFSLHNNQIMHISAYRPGDQRNLWTVLLLAASPALLFLLVVNYPSYILFNIEGFSDPPQHTWLRLVDQWLNFFYRVRVRVMMLARNQYRSSKQSLQSQEPLVAEEQERDHDRNFDRFVCLFF